MSLRNVLLSLTVALAIAASAQPTWRFHLAFEDGTGSRDTLWFIYDTTATLPVNPWPGPNVDYDLGEGPTDMSDGLFHVFTLNALMDSTNTVATPYTWYPMFETGGNINAINWTPPMTISWDTAMFHAPYLPYDQGSINQAYLLGNYFFFHSNDGSKIGFNMLITDHVEVDEDAIWLFVGCGVYFSGEGSTIGMTEPPHSAKLAIWPNPAQDELHIRGLGDAVCTLRILDSTGRLVLGQEAVQENSSISLRTVVPGAYLFELKSAIGTIQRGHLVVER